MPTSQRNVILVGAGAAPFREGLIAALKTDWAVTLALDPLSDHADAFATADAAISSKFDAEWPAAPQLRMLQVPGAGYDGIDLGALSPVVTLCNVFEHDAGVAEYTLLAMLEWQHRLGPADADMRGGVWARSSRFGGAADEELLGKTLVVVGVGRIGRAVARRARAFDMTVVGVNRTVRDEPDFDRVVGLDRLHEALAEADFVALACALTDETKGLIDAAALASMRPHAVIVNPARGPVIDEAALYAALKDRRIGGAAIDTWWDYPMTPAPRDPSLRFPFHTLDNVLLSPHVAGWTTGTIRRRIVEMARNLDRFARGEELANIVRAAG
jgi:phosphoglycerate dehydrogenase-like enzyme